MAIRDVKPKLATSNQTITGGSITKVADISLTFTADDSTSTVITGQITGGDKYIVELVETIDTTSTTKFVTMPDTDGNYGFAFTPTTNATYKINVYRDIR